MRVARIARLPTPHAYLDLSLSNHIEVGPLLWDEWRELRGGGARSFLRWLIALLTLTALPSEDDLRALRHCKLVGAGVCHIYRDQGWCFCDERKVRP